MLVFGGADFLDMAKFAILCGLIVWDPNFCSHCHLGSKNPTLGHCKGSNIPMMSASQEVKISVSNPPKHIMVYTVYQYKYIPSLNCNLMQLYFIKTVTSHMYANIHLPQHLNIFNLFTDRLSHPTASRLQHVPVQHQNAGRIHDVQRSKPGKTKTSKALGWIKKNEVSQALS